MQMAEGRDAFLQADELEAKATKKKLRGHLLLARLLPLVLGGEVWLMCVRERNRRLEAGVSIHVVGHRHQAAVFEPHLILALSAAYVQ